LAYVIPPLIITSEGWDENEIKLERVNHVLQSEITQILIKGALEAINIAKTLVSSPYPPPSQPNTPPHLRTGKLQESIDILKIENFAVEFGSDLPYSFYLEFGTSKMRPRPHMVPAVIEAMKLYPELLSHRIQEELR